jgi:hypothetical protein
MIRRLPRRAAWMKRFINPIEQSRCRMQNISRSERQIMQPSYAVFATRRTPLGDDEERREDDGREVQQED